ILIRSTKMSCCTDRGSAARRAPAGPAAALTYNMRMKVKVLRLPEQVTAANAAQLKTQIKDTIQREKCLLELDLADVSYMDSAGLGVMVFAYEQSKSQGGSVRIHRPLAPVRELFQKTRFNQVLTIVDGPPDGEA